MNRARPAPSTLGPDGVSSIIFRAGKLGDIFHSDGRQASETRGRWHSSRQAPTSLLTADPDGSVRGALGQHRPRQNQVTPFGDIVASSERGRFMGNRGCLHDEAGNIIRTSARDTWICCLIKYSGIHRTLMAPGHYTELFFADEATALAAGHRRCRPSSRHGQKPTAAQACLASPTSTAGSLVNAVPSPHALMAKISLMGR
jgi:hypothetical protein